ncbi:MAG: hypothetical protein IJX33_10575 [Akkermansia sp.]|nr:hypothetical protein [Akkermansia sp.]
MSKETKESAAAASSSGVTSNDGAAPTVELVRVKLKKKAHVAGCIAAPGAVLNVTKESADRLVADGVAVILY